MASQIDPHGTSYDDLGSRTAPVVALIHGLGLTRETWAAQLGPLTEIYRVINYDLVGHGRTALPEGEISLSSFSEQLRLLLDHLEISSCAAVGFSLGGMINRRLAVDHPQLVSSLAILNSPHARGDEAQRLVEERAAASSAGGPGATIDATIQRWFTADYRASNPPLVDQVRQWVLANDHVAYAKARMVLAQGVVELIRPEPPITKPTLVMTCEHDTGSTPAMSHAIASEIPDAQTIIVPGVQHLGLLEQPDAFTQPLLEFLSGTFQKEV